MIISEKTDANINKDVLGMSRGPSQTLSKSRSFWVDKTELGYGTTELGYETTKDGCRGGSRFVKGDSTI